MKVYSFSEQYWDSNKKQNTKQGFNLQYRQSQFDLYRFCFSLTPYHKLSLPSFFLGITCALDFFLFFSGLFSICEPLDTGNKEIGSQSK